MNQKTQRKRFKENNKHTIKCCSNKVCAWDWCDPNKMCVTGDFYHSPCDMVIQWIKGSCFFLGTFVAFQSSKISQHWDLMIFTSRVGAWPWSGDALGTSSFFWYLDNFQSFQNFQKFQIFKIFSIFPIFRIFQNF